MSHSTKKLDLTGQRFGRLTVLGPVSNIGNKTAWRCRCDCGNELDVKTGNLRAGKVRSCGCLGDMGQNLHFIDGTCVEMLRKNVPRRNNNSGVVGVEWRRRERCWRASICFKGKRQYLGLYKNFDDAVRARKEAEARTHGSFLADYDANNAVAAPEKSVSPSRRRRGEETKRERSHRRKQPTDRTERERWCRRQKRTGGDPDISYTQACASG